MADIERFMRDAHILARLVEQILERGYLERASRDSVTFDQLNILKFLARPPRKLVKHVAGFLSASYAAASKAVDRLEAKGLVTCATYEKDRRAETVDVTPKGHRLIRTYERYKRARLKAALRGESSDQLAEGLERVIVALMRERTVTGNPCLGCGAYYAEQCVSRAHGHPCAAASCE
jgi:DNA-binding MarR family transcriptional regulator